MDHAALVRYSDAERAEISRLSSSRTMALWQALRPEFDRCYAELGGALSGDMARDVLPLFRHLSDRSDAFREWHRLNYQKQDDMWAFAMRVAHGRLDTLRAQFAALPTTAAAGRRGSLRLDAGLVPPKYVTQSEGFHRQPGGYCADRDECDIRAGLLYDTANDCFFRGLADGLRDPAVAAPGALAAELAACAAREFPARWARWAGGAPLRVLDVGCGTGLPTVAWKRLFPHAEVHGADVGAGMLRWGHLQAERQGVAVHFAQEDAAELRGYDDASFDLVVSHILFHEVSPRAWPRALAACRRVLRPGGAMLHIDIASAARFPAEGRAAGAHARFNAHWQAYFQGEPFLGAFSEARMADAGREGGVRLTVDKHAPARAGPGGWYIFGLAAPGGPRL